MHQDPQVPNYRVRDRGPIVRSGLAVAIEPMITLGSAETEELDDGWTVVTQDGSRAAHWENSVAVTDAGIWVLTALDGGQERLEALGAAYAAIDADISLTLCSPSAPATISSALGSWRSLMRRLMSILFLHPPRGWLWWCRTLSHVCQAA